MNIAKILENNQKWVEEKLNSDTEYFNNLSRGQSPEILYIGCSDSRVTPEYIMGVQPGEVFVHRNIANTVSDLDLSSVSVIEYAVTHLKVKQIMIVGHYECGGVKAAMSHENLGVLNPWISNVRNSYFKHETKLNLILDEKERYKKLIELNVKEQCLNIKKIPSVKDALNRKEVSVHGLIWDIYTGKLIDMKF